MRRVLLILLLVATSLPLSARTLHWNLLDVDARLDGEGRLHVIERQTMVFDGSWNGGERTFRIEPGQRIELHSMTRTDPVNGAVYQLRKGDLDAIDEYDWIDSSTLRWRSRLPSDPPFDERVLIYELDYTMSNVVVHLGEDRFLLDHDFAFADRVGEIEQFRLDLELDPAWKATAPFDRALERSGLPPGSGVVVTVPMEYVGSGTPSGVEMAAAGPVRFGLAIVLLAGAGFCLKSLINRERQRGRFEPLTPSDQIDEGWLVSNVFTIPPEVVGAAWDSRIAAPEVAAMLARMVSEKKLSSRTEGGSTSFFGSKPVLHLELLVPKDELSSSERDLVNGLFPGNRTATSTEIIREHYENRGFSPASKIRRALEKTARKLYRGTKKLDLPFLLSTKGILLILAATVAAAGATAWMSPGSLLAVVLTAIGSTMVFVVAAIIAGITKNRVEGVGAWIGLTAGLLAVVVAAAIVITLSQPLTLIAALAVDLIAFFFFAVGMRIMATSNSQSQIALRKRLASARRHFLEELKRQEPRLRDDWFPWLIAFGLGGHVDHWFRSFGSSASSVVTRASSSPGSSGGASAPSWSGGGGSFGGAGATATWVAAASSISSGVPAPSSSGSGGSSGGGGGGGSSGGGGGGGW